MSLIDELIEGFTSAIDDIRHNVVEQGWFGQETTSDISDGVGTTGIEAPEITAPEISPAQARQQDESIMDMFTPPAEADMQQERGQEQGIDV